MKRDRATPANHQPDAIDFVVCADVNKHAAIGHHVALIGTAGQNVPAANPKPAALDVDIAREITPVVVLGGPADFRGIGESGTRVEIQIASSLERKDATAAMQGLLTMSGIAELDGIPVHALGDDHAFGIARGLKPIFLPAVGRKHDTAIEPDTNRLPVEVLDALGHEERLSKVVLPEIEDGIVRIIARRDLGS